MFNNGHYINRGKTEKYVMLKKYRLLFILEMRFCLGIVFKVNGFDAKIKYLNFKIQT